MILDNHELHLMAQHGRCFEQIAIKAINNPEITQEKEVQEALKQSVTILIGIVKEIEKKH